MNYSQDEFFKLLEAVEAEGGQHLAERCHRDVPFVFTGPAKPQLPELGSCGNYSLFEVPYEAQTKSGDNVGLQPLQACAVEDDMARWPRFGGDRFAAPEFFVPFPPAE